MPFHRKLWITAALITVFLLAGCSLAEDVTPPPNYRPPTQPPEQPAADEVAFPQTPPDPAQGEAIYAEKCLPCHGETGLGDGPQAGNLPNPAAPIGSPDLARQTRPVDWFRIVTVGNLEKFMPGFSQSLTDSQRWDVVAYTYSLSVSPAELEQGRALYEQNCADCHGETGQGDGPQAASLPTKPAAWNQDLESLAQLSADDMAQVMTGGLDGHPDFGDELDESERYSVAAYARTLSFASPVDPGQAASAETPEPGATPEPGTTQTPDGTAVAQVPQQITIRGQVTNATPGSSLPEGMQASLLAFSGMNPAFDQTIEVASDGSYTFEDVQYDPELVYMVRVEANGLSFNSDILHGSDVSGNEADLPVQVYETTTDTAGLRAERLHVFFDFSKPGAVQVVNLFIISNSSDRIVTPAGEEQPMLEFSLPEGATNLQFQDGELGGRFVETANGFGDRMTIAPGTGQHQVLFAYEMPYDRKLDLTLNSPLSVESAIVMVPPGGVKLKSSQLVDAGQRDVQGMSFQMYQAANSLNAGDPLTLQLSGRADGTGASEAEEMNYLLIGLAGFGLVLVAAGIWLFRRRAALQLAYAGAEDLDGEPAGEPEQTSESILDAILALDDLHASGKLPEEAYQERRADLKAQLADALEREKGGSAGGD